MFGTEIDENRINSIIDEIAELDKQNMRYRVQSIQNMKKILTQEQYETMREKYKAKRESGEGFGKRRKRGED